MLQQNKQAKRITYHKFIAIKSTCHKRKTNQKKAISIPVRSFYSRNQNSISSCDFISKLHPNQNQQQIAHRRLSSHKNPASAIYANIVTIKFNDDNKICQRIIQQKKQKKGNNFFNLNLEQPKKQILPLKIKSHKYGTVDEALVIQPLHCFISHLEETRKKQTSYVGTSKKKSRKNKRSIQIIQADSSLDVRQFGKQIMKAQFYRKVRLNLKQNKFTTQLVQKKLKNKQSYTPSKNLQSIESNVQRQRVQKYKQKEMIQGLLREYKEILPLRKPTHRKDYFVFGMSDKSNQPENKIQLYRDYLWKLNYSNGLYVNTPENVEVCYKAYIGSGNNSCMLKSILSRRGWWTIIDNIAQAQQCNFVWTQLQLKPLYRIQPSTPSTETYRQNHESQQQRNSLLESCQEPELALSHERIFNSRDKFIWEEYLKYNARFQQKISEQTYNKRLKLYVKKYINRIMDSQKLLIHNHLQFSYYIGNKKALYYNIKRLCQHQQQNPFQYIPITFHISKGTEDPIYKLFTDYYNKMEDIKKIDKNFRNMWICKPGQNTNRGMGISVCVGLDDIKHRLRGKQKNGDGKTRTFIIQKYIQRPFLYKNRKFDIRHYLLITCFNGKIKAYWFEQGYIRTSSTTFNLKNSIDLMIHLTNDAVQKKGQSYGKHEKGNKVSYEQFQNYLDLTHKKKYDFLGATLRKMKQIALLAVEATYMLLDANRKQHNFQLIGLDFMIDENFKPWLIEANTNPCLELSSPLLERLIPCVVEQTFRICVDPFFPPPENYVVRNKFIGGNALLQNRYELIFDQVTDGKRIEDLLDRNNAQFNQIMAKIEEDNEVFEDDGNDDWQQNHINQ